MDGNTNAATGDQQSLLAALGGAKQPRICATEGCNTLTEGVPCSPEPNAPMVYLSRFCEKCVWEIRREEREAKQIERNNKGRGKRTEWWLKTWKEDSIYHDTDIERLPDQAATEKVLRWHPGLAKGILLQGESGSGKTRTVYMLLKRLLFDHGIYPTIKKCVLLRHEISRAAKSDDDGARPALMKQLIEAPILYLDDLGQMASTASAEEALLAIVEERTQVGRPIIATSQLTGDRFIQQFAMKERGEAIARRLGDFCYRVNFTRPHTTHELDIIP